jgi:D-3-phosphoglycerate dehydrogenase / 2-oxoglutarate reductase
MKVLVGFSEKEYPNVKKFNEIGNCTFVRYDREYLLENIGKYDILIPHLFEKIDLEVMSCANKLKILATPSTGKDHIDLEAVESFNIHFISLNDNRSFINEITSTAEMNWLLILSCMRSLRDLMDRVKIGKSWVNTDIRGYELNNKVLGIIGYGRLGKMVAQYGRCFGMKVIVYDIDSSKYDDNIQVSELNDLFIASDVISLNAKLNPTSANIINYNAISRMKDGVVIVNTARGGMIDSNAVLEGLDSGKIASIGLDVCNNEFESSQLPKDPLVERSFLDNKVIITPHAGGSTYDAHSKVFGQIAELIKKYLSSPKDCK